MGGKKKNSNIQNASEEGKLVWTPMMDEALMDAFLHQHNLGNRVNGSFTTKAYENIVNELKEKLGKEVDKDKVKNRIKTLKANLSKSHDLFKNLSGFSWSPVTKLWSAEPEVWDALIKVNNDAKEWMTKPVLHYDTFVILFGNDRATGEKSETAKELKKKQSSQHDNEPHNTIEEIDHMVSQNQVSLDDFGTNDVDFDPLTCLGGPSNVPTSSKSKKIKKSQEIENEAMGIQEAINNVARALSEGNSRPPLSEAEVWNMLEDLGLNSDQITTAYLYLLEHPDKLRAVLGCPPGRRLDIVMRVVFGTS
ncbi:hypothetical protein SLA2020_086320 [Shorea laevis]